MVLLHDIVEILDLADLDGRFTLGVHGVQPGQIGFKTFRCAQILLGGIEVMHMIAKGQMMDGAVPKRSVSEQFYILAT